MQISTKNGDQGFTTLLSGEKVVKDHSRIEAFGTLDELDASLGEAKHYCQSPNNKIVLEEIQHLLKNCMACLARTNIIDSLDDLYLNAIIEQFEEKVSITELVVPGKTLSSAKLDTCRTICRRAERRIISLAKEEKISTQIIPFVNRLSDLLFLMARNEEQI